MEFDAYSALVRARRTNLMIDRQRDLDTNIVAQLCELSTWAPNHKLTWPWLFAEVRGDARLRLGGVCADVMAQRGEPEVRVTKTRGKFARTPVVLIIGAEVGDTELRTAENRDAVAAAVQTLLLGATALGLASFWSSCPTGANDAVAQFCEFPHDTTIVAMVYLGWPTDVPKGVERPAAQLRRIHQ
jgi:nitroreductase